MTLVQLSLVQFILVEHIQSLTSIMIGGELQASGVPIAWTPNLRSKPVDVRRANTPHGVSGSERGSVGRIIDLNAKVSFSGDKRGQ